MNLENDFLDKNAYLIAINVRNNYIRYYELIDSIAHLMSKILETKELKSYSDDLEKYIISTLYDCYTTYSAEIKLLEYGFVTEFRVLLRNFYEKKFKIYSVILNKDNYNKIIREGIIYGEQLINILRENKFGTFNENKINIDYSKKNSKQSRKKTSPKEWARLANLEEDYSVKYSYLSGTIHYNICFNLEKFSKNDGKDIYDLYNYETFESNVLIASEEMFNIIKKILKFKKYVNFNEDIKIINSLFFNLDYVVVE